jgi:hypothetical protein
MSKISKLKAENSRLKEKNSKLKAENLKLIEENLKFMAENLKIKEGLEPDKEALRYELQPSAATKEWHEQCEFLRHTIDAKGHSAIRIVLAAENSKFKAETVPTIPTKPDKEARRDERLQRAAAAKKDGVPMRRSRASQEYSEFVDDIATSDSKLNADPKMEVDEEIKEVK